MHPSALLLVLVAAGIAGVRGHPAAAGTPAARFWEEVLPGTPMPEAIAELVQEGIDRSPLKERYAAPYFLPSACLGYTYQITCGKPPPSEEAEAVTGLFFHEAQVRTGSVMTVSFPPAATPAILPRDVAEKVPFASVTDVLTTFNIPPRSAEAMQVRDTLRGCRAPPLAGEQKACATSLEGTVRSAMGMLGTTTSGKVWAAASALPRDGLPRQEYVVSAVSPLDGDRHVACHDEPYPYAVFQCHMTGRSSTKAYMITLSGRSPAVTMAALCHRDTSNWNPAHPAFEMLGTQPGGAPVCHFMPYANLVFGEKTGFH
ncbi:protein RAFTIN 1B-like [Phragmites australis]|uniref:protein RAFTIN 1B-like n=1 Tax=Phragmites australis TaxID=29695 RepID=UPI002D77F0C6|nr:protein RAFTIN 1B-like [Phragmites australis]